MQGHIVAQKLVDEHVLLRHLHQTVSLLSHSSHSTKNRDFWSDACVPLRPNIYDVVGQADGGACAAYSCRAMNNYFLLLFRCQDHHNKVLQHELEGRHRVTGRNPMVWPSCVVQLLNLLVLYSSCLITHGEVSSS